MDEDLRTFLAGMETRLTAQVRDAETRLVAQVRDAEFRIDERVAEKIGDSETKLLRAFWEWGRTIPPRQSGFPCSKSVSLLSSAN